MKRLIIICEGETEKEFCKTLLYDRFLSREIQLSNPLVKKTAGGICSWSALQKQIQGHLGEGAFVTTFIDYYGIREGMKFPGWKEAERMDDKNERVEFLEKKMSSSVGNPCFIPYYQLHEFESLLFNDVSFFEQLFPKNEISDKRLLERTLSEFDNPELINNGKQTSPSHRMSRIIQGYDKVLYGNLLALEIGLGRIRSKCPRFNAWLTKLESIG